MLINFQVLTLECATASLYFISIVQSDALSYICLEGRGVLPFRNEVFESLLYNCSLNLKNHENLAFKNSAIHLDPTKNL